MMNVLEHPVEGLAELQPDESFKIRFGGEVYHFTGFEVGNGERVRVIVATMGLGGMPFTVHQTERIPPGLTTNDGGGPIS